MSYKAMDWVCEQPIADPTAKFVLLMIAKHADEQWQCFPSAARIAKLTGLDSRTVQRKVAALKKQGYLFVSRRNNGGRQTSNLYTIHKPNEGRQSAAPATATCRPINISTNKSDNISSSITTAERHPSKEEDEKETDWTDFANQILGKSNGRDDSKMGD